MQKKIILPLVMMLGLVFVFQACDNYTIDYGVTYVSYSESVQPIFDTKCIKCHSGGNLNLSAGQSKSSLETGEFVDFDSPSDSYILRKLESDRGHGGTGVNGGDIYLIRAWIQEEASLKQ